MKTEDTQNSLDLYAGYTDYIYPSVASFCDMHEN